MRHVTRRGARCVVIGVAVVPLLSACSLPNPFGEPATRKVVAGKERPRTLVATDDTRCQVDQQRFDRVEIGEEVWCLWRREAPPGRLPVNAE